MIIFPFAPTPCDPFGFVAGASGGLWRSSGDHPQKQLQDLRKRQHQEYQRQTRQTRDNSHLNELISANGKSPHLADNRKAVAQITKGRPAPGSQRGLADWDGITDPLVAE